MATISHTQTAFSRGQAKVEWTGLGSGDTGDSADIHGASEITIQLDGTFSGTPTVNIEGSNDGSTWFNLQSKAGSNVSATAADIVALQEFPLYFRPNVSSGDGSTNINVRAALSFSR